MIFVFYRGEMHVHRQDDTGFEEVVGAECKSVLKVVAVDRASILSVNEFVNVLAGDSRDLFEEGFLRLSRIQAGIHVSGRLLVQLS